MLHETNKQLRDLPVDELDRPENRRRIESQAAAESANGRRLTALTGTGELLLRQAMRNDQFNVATLEDWATMLQVLKEIADQRMPTVADLLKQAAAAPASVAAAPGSVAPDASSRPQVGNNRDPRAAGGKPPESGPPNQVPTIVDIESSFNELDASKQQQDSASKGGAGRFGLPETVVQGGGAPREQANQPPASPAQEKVDQAVQQQQDLLAEFAKVADELQRILNNLEGSTFVKRLKAASRRQLEVATDLNQGLLDAFGVEAAQVAPPQRELGVSISDRELAHSDDVYRIQTDLEAYFNRVQDGKFKLVVGDMESEQIVARIRDVADAVKQNFSGQSIAHAEYWADTLDRWAEQLVGPGCPGQGPCPGAKGDSLPPSVVLEVMKILEAEIALREETRSLEHARAALASEEYGTSALALAETQQQLAQRVDDVVLAIEGIDDAQLRFGDEIALLNRAGQVMLEAHALLAKPSTGPEAIAAETEVIELLMQSRRVNPQGGGGSGSTPGAGGGGSTQQTALALVGAGDELEAHGRARAVQQSTGTAGSALPAEFRHGLDAYFSALEGTQ
jgi:hypothetical protein